MVERRMSGIWIGGSLLLSTILGVGFWMKRGEPQAELGALPERALEDEAVPHPQVSGAARSPVELEMESPSSARWNASDLPELEAIEAEGETPEQRSRRWVLPVLEAIRNPALDPEERRLRMLAALRASGESDEPWTQTSRQIFTGWERALPQAVELKMELEKSKCFQAGCVVPVVFPNREAAELAAREFRKLSVEEAAHGGRVQTPADFVEEGKLEASWIFLRPSG